MPLGQRIDCGEAKYAGVSLHCEADIVQSLQDCLECGFDFLVAPLASSPERRPAPVPQTPGQAPPPPFAPSDMLLSSAQWSSQVVGRVSSWIDLDSPDLALRRDSEVALAQELAWAGHLSQQACILPPPPRGLRCARYARALNHALMTQPNMALWVTLPLAPPAGEEEKEDEAGGSAVAVDPPSAADDPWEWWHLLRCACDHSTRLCVALDVSRLPAEPAEPSLERWRGENLRAVFLDAALFKPNRHGHWVLSKRLQSVLGEAFAYGVQVALTVDGGRCFKNETSREAVPEESSSSSSAPAPSRPVAFASPPSPQVLDLGQREGLKARWEYLSYLFRKAPPAGAGETSAGELGYRDYLQSPLQPLQDNLESQTYETFEADAIKYTSYEEAIARALRDTLLTRARNADGEQAPITPPEYADPSFSLTADDGNAPPCHVRRPPLLPPPCAPEDAEAIVAVVGAGRGPLVAAALSAASKTGVRVHVFAVEKNPNAVLTLQHRHSLDGWAGRVSLVAGDMRDWKPRRQVDVLVSELLGSFGDNELSPECLDGAQSVLREGGICVPQSYASFLAPLSTHKLWTDARGFKEVERFETPYVVRMHRARVLAPPQRVHEFVHPAPQPADNERCASLSFSVDGQGASVCHGFVGYFDTELYGGVRLSIVPETHTPGMNSWFPIYFPVHAPFYVPKDSTIEVTIWRKTSRHKVWYEWLVTSPVPSVIHNPRGRSYYVGL
ncbi:PRMT5 arginine-N-methyltransferase [Helicosporidium sp. ATCC 50920]|nr:PRMT5 arginine-N-methyltransferase [Helicosporidium sp. ATCC 50920]|eukprot:KDD76850.1 PRMT5 arginine-N-methyltransferase [Helicosporidium sp. ATCC 50920]